MDDLRLFSLLIDFGLVILILMVQLTIYPSFKYFERTNLVTWHQKYTGQIAIVVAPLMIAQIIIASYYAITITSLLTVTIGVLAVGAWVSTFLLFVPIHNRITNASHSKEDLIHLVQRNWIRVGIWIAILFLNFYKYNQIA